MSVVCRLRFFILACILRTVCVYMSSTLPGSLRLVSVTQAYDKYLSAFTSFYQLLFVIIFFTFGYNKPPVEYHAWNSYIIILNCISDYIIKCRTHSKKTNHEKNYSSHFIGLYFYIIL